VKYKFHEQAPEFDFDSEDGYSLEPELYTKEVNWIAKHLNFDVNKFKVNDMTFSDPVLFYKGQYMGYLDNLFYRAFDVDDFPEWWDFDN
jgi:hypothetical protein